jgi:hypothetical protein
MPNLLQSSKLIFNLLPTLFIVISIVCGTPIKDLYGDYLCWIFSGLLNSSGIKQTLGGFFIAIYRIICLKKPKIAMSLQNQRKLKNHLLCLELATMVLLFVYFYEGANITGTEPTMEFLR